MTIQRRILLVLAVLAIPVAFVNFFWVLADWGKLEGDASGGYQRDGHYFVGNHGKYREVTQGEWTWSRMHTMSLLVTHPLAIAGGAYLLFMYVFPAAIGAKAEPGEERVSDIVASGAPLLRARTGGLVGSVSMSVGLLRVEVYPGGVVLRPPFMKPLGLFLSDIRAITPKKAFIIGTFSEFRLAPGLPALVLYTPPTSSIVRQIERLRTEAVLDAGGAPNMPDDLPLLSPVARGIWLASVVVSWVLVGVAVVLPRPLGILFPVIFLIASLNTFHFVFRTRR